MSYRIQSEGLTATINAQGAELQSLKTTAGHELLWQADAKVWGRHAPHLFPIVGKFKDDRYVHNGTTYPMTPHGFARDLLFTATHIDNDACTMELRDSEVTRARYPFAFVLTISHRLAGNSLHVRYTVRNPGSTPLFMSVGAHPAFNWPLRAGIAREAHRLVFGAEEPAPIRRIAGGLLRATTEETPVVGRELKLSDSLFVDDVMIFDRLHARKLTYTAPDAPRLAFDFGDFPTLGVWTKPGAGFICIEPWQGHPTPVGFDGELRDKPGIVALAPQDERVYAYSITVN